MIVDDFADINRRMNRRPEVVAAVEAPTSGIAIWQKMAAAAMSAPVVAEAADIAKYRADLENLKRMFAESFTQT